MSTPIRKESFSGCLEDSPGCVNGSHPGLLKDHEYPALSVPGYSEKPLSEQLEPIAVVGMGMLKYLTSSKEIVFVQ